MSLGYLWVVSGGLWGFVACLWGASGASFGGSLEDLGVRAGGTTLRCRNHCNLHGFSSRYDVSRRRNAPKVQKVL